MCDLILNCVSLSAEYVCRYVTLDAANIRNWYMHKEWDRAEIIMCCFLSTPLATGWVMNNGVRTKPNQGKISLILVIVNISFRKLKRCPRSNLLLLILLLLFYIKRFVVVLLVWRLILLIHSCHFSIRVAWWGSWSYCCWARPAAALVEKSSALGSATSSAGKVQTNRKVLHPRRPCYSQHCRLRSDCNSHRRLCCIGGGWKGY